MPIRPEQRHLYPKDWPEISKRIREREGQRCKLCKAPNGAAVLRGTHGDAGTYMLDDGHVFDADTGEPRGRARASEYEGRLTVIVLTVSHTDHDPTNNDESNLRALCQKCHLHHDKPHHQALARETRRRRKAAGNLPGVE